MGLHGLIIRLIYYNIIQSRNKIFRMSILSPHNYLFLPSLGYLFWYIAAYLKTHSDGHYNMSDGLVERVVESSADGLEYSVYVRFVFQEDVIWLYGELHAIQEYCLPERYVINLTIKKLKTREIIEISPPTRRRMI